MTLKELYADIGGDYEQALRVLRMDKLLDKHIRKLINNTFIDQLSDAGKAMDPARLFDAAHAAKGVFGNLGLTALANAASDIAEEFRPGSPRRMSDDEVSDRLQTIADLYQRTAEGIRRYEQA